MAYKDHTFSQAIASSVEISLLEQLHTFVAIKSIIHQNTYLISLALTHFTKRTSTSLTHFTKRTPTDFIMAATRVSAAKKAPVRAFRAFKSFKFKIGKATASPPAAPPVTITSNRNTTSDCRDPSVDVPKSEGSISSEEEIFSRRIRSHERDLVYLLKRVHKYRVYKLRSRKTKRSYRRHRHYSDSLSSLFSFSALDSEGGKRLRVFFKDNEGKKPFLSLLNTFPAINVKYFK